MGDTIGLFDAQGNQVATVNPKSGEISIDTAYQKQMKLSVNFSSHIPVVEIKDSKLNQTIFQIVLPVEKITNIKLLQGKPNYQQITLEDQSF